MKKVLSFLTCVCMITVFFGNITICAVDLSYYEEKELIKTQTSSFNDKSNYNGKKTTNPHIDVKSFADLDILGSGGSHIDGDGNIVFSNYVAWSVYFNFDKLSKQIFGTNIKVSDDSCDWNDMNKANGYKYGDASSTEKPISYGAIVATRTDGNGNVFKYEPVFSNGNTSFEQQYFNIDGDYTIYVFFETVKNGKYQNHILSWSFKVRTSIYLLDKTSGLHIKDSGISGNDVIIDCASRSGVEVQIWKKDKEDKEEKLIINFSESTSNDIPPITESGTYKFVVTNNGFVCEVFNFTIDKKSVDKKVFFSNLRRQIGKATYEAEGYFSFEWDEKAANPIQSAQYSYCDAAEKDLTDLKEAKFSAPIEYTPKTELNKAGIYKIIVFDGKETATYFVTVVNMDKPADNYDKLASERFNNFKTKWWQVYDESSGRYLCFDYETEYNLAYNAAMSVANNTVITSTGRYFFKGVWYNDRIDLTAAMNEYVFEHNLSVFYYDPSDYANNAESERTFSPNAFDHTIYLNDEFQFVSSHPAEVDTVTLTDSYGKNYNIEFSKPISQQKDSIPNGEYQVKEIDKYGNENIYTALRDKTAPEVTISSNGSKTRAANGRSYSFSNFSVSEMKDAFDDYAVLKIEHADNVLYYYKSEYNGVIFEEKGTYKISAYDRNGNILSFSIMIS